MKTIAFNNRSNLLRGLFLLAAVGGLYYFRKQGGSMSHLFTKGSKSLSSARTWIKQTAPSISQNARA